MERQDKIQMSFKFTVNGLSFINSALINKLNFNSS